MATLNLFSEINTLEKVRSFRCGRQMTPRDCILPKKFWEWRITQEFVSPLYMTNKNKSSLSYMFYNINCIKNTHSSQDPTHRCSAHLNCKISIESKQHKINQRYHAAYSAILSRRFIGNSQRPSLRILT